MQGLELFFVCKVGNLPIADLLQKLRCVCLVGIEYVADKQAVDNCADIAATEIGNRSGRVRFARSRVFDDPTVFNGNFRAVFQRVRTVFRKCVSLRFRTVFKLYFFGVKGAVRVSL